MPYDKNMKITFTVIIITIIIKISLNLLFYTQKLISN